MVMANLMIITGYMLMGYCAGKLLYTKMKNAKAFN